MNTPPQASRDPAASTPTQGPANPPARLLLANGDVPVREPRLEEPVRAGSPVDAAKATSHNTPHEHWGINE